MIPLQSVNRIFTRESLINDSFLRFSYVFWIGDLNFRLNGEDLSAEDIDLLVKKNQLELLLDRDQLRTVMHSGEAFSELVENDITFSPTYKYEFASQQFDFKYVILISSSNVDLIH